MDMNRPHLGAEVIERRHSETSVPLSQNMASNLEFPHPHFAVIYLDHNGKLQVEASPSIAGCGGAIFTPEVTDRFMEMTVPNSQPRIQFPNPNQPPSTWGMQPNLGWMQSGLPRPAEMIPCEWQQHQTRRKRRDLKRAGMPKPRPKSASPPPTPPPGRSVLRVGDRDMMLRYYEKAFEDFQQLNCRAIAKSYIKLVEPRKQVHFPYNGRKVIGGVSQRVDPEFTKPGWWPADVQHKEPDHLLKGARLRLLVHILCELKDSHGVTADKLQEAGQDVRRQITPANRLQVLDEIYFVRRMEEQYLDGEIDANTLIQVTHTHLPEASFQDDRLTKIHAALDTALDAEDEGQDPGDNVLDDGERFTVPSQQGMPLSPATSDSSGPHSPTTGYGSYPMRVAPNILPQETKPMPETAAMPGYFAPPLAPAVEKSGYWSNMPSGMQFGY